MSNQVKDDGTARSNSDLPPKVEKTKGHVEMPNTSPLQANETPDQRAARRERQTDLANDTEDEREAVAKATGETLHNGDTTLKAKTITRDHPVKPRHERKAAEAQATQDAQADGAPQAGNDPEQYETGSQPAVQNDPAHKK